MIISDKYQFCFVHIPKCAGTSVRVKLKNLDDTGGKFTSRIEKHPDIGMLDYVHMPLETLEKYFSKELTKIRDYHSVAIIRDPHERFASSVSQFINKHSDRRIEELSLNEIKQIIDACISFLSANGDLIQLPPEYIHFQKQSSYVYLKGERLINKLYLMDEVHSLIKDVEEIIGYDLAVECSHENKSVVYRSGVVGALHKNLRPFLGKVFHKLLPEKAKDTLRNIVYVSRNNKLRNVFEQEEINKFIDKYYVEYILLFDEVKKMAMR